MCVVEIRTDGSDNLTITLLGRSHPGSQDYWDGNWLRARVEVIAGGFRASVTGDLRAEELCSFSEQLSQLQRVLRGNAVFETMEHWLSLDVEGDGRGHLIFKCELRDDPVRGNALNCTLGTDQTFMGPVLAGLAEAVRRFPVIGNPGPSPSPS